jgi:hypothetical protein
MVLDATAKEKFVKDSLKKFFVDGVFRTGKVKLTFDKALSVPRIQGNVPAIQWISVRFGELKMGTMSDMDMEVFCCTRQDPEYDKLAELRDVAMSYLSDTTKTDGMKRIPFYNSDSWTQIGAILVHEVLESAYFDGPDQTKYKVLTCFLKFASKV